LGTIGFPTWTFKFLSNSSAPRPSTFEFNDTCSLVEVDCFLVGFEEEQIGIKREGLEELGCGDITERK
jgi:hypothetical protein